MRTRIKVFIVYTLCNFLMLLNRGAFWDDWTVFNMSWEGLHQQWINNGMVFPMYIYDFLNHLPLPVFWFHLVSFILGFLVVDVFLELMKKLNVLNADQLLVLGLMLAATPLYHTRILLISIQYAACLLSFLVATNLLLSNLENGKIVYRMAAFALFFFSFIISSLVVFYGAVILLVLIRKNIRTLKGVLAYADLFVLPVAFWLFKSKFLVPGGLHAMENYNKVTASGLGKSPMGIIESFKLSFFTMLTMMFETLTKNFAILVALLTFLFSLMMKTVHPKEVPETTLVFRVGKFNISYMTAILAAGFILYTLGAFPYAVVGKIPMFENFNARNQLLLPFGTAMILLAFTELVIRGKYKRYMYGFVIASCLVINTQRFFNYQKDTFRQSAIVENMRSLDLSQHHTIMVHDSTTKYVETETSQAVYTGMAKYVTGEQTRLLISEEKAEGIISTYGSLDALIIDGASLNVQDWKPAPFDSRLYLNNGSLDLSSMSTMFRLLYYQWAKPEVFSNTVKQAVEMRLEKI